MTKNICLALFIVITWASAFPIIGVGVKELGAFGLPALRFFVSGLIAFIYLVSVRPPLPNLKECLILALAIFFNFFLYQALLNYGQLYVLSGLASFIVNTNPLAMIFLATFFLNEKAGKYLWLGTFIALFGLGLIALSRGASEGELNIYVILIAISGVCAAIGNALQKPLLHKYPPMTIACLGMAIAVIYFLPFLPEAFAKFPLASLSVQVGVIYLGIAPAFLATLAFIYLMKHWGVANTTPVIFAVPPVALLFGAVFLGEVPPLQALIGACFTLAGVYLATRK